MFQPGTLATEFSQDENAVCFCETLERAKEVLDWRSEFAVEPVVNRTLGDAKQMSKLLLLKVMPGRTFRAVQGPLECSNDLMAGFVIGRRKKEFTWGLRFAWSQFFVSHGISSAENSRIDSG